MQAVNTPDSASMFGAPPDAAVSAEPPAHVQVIQMATAFWVSRAVYVAARLGIADLLADGPKSVQALADATQTHGPSLYRLLRALASLGLFTESGGQRFALTEHGATLQTGAPGSARSTVMALAGPWMWGAWSEFAYSVQTGKTAFNKAWGMPLFDYLAQHSDEARFFGEAMMGVHGGEAAAVAAAYDFSAQQTVIDVGGGTGGLLAAILQEHPHLQGVLYELPHVAPEARAHLTACGVVDRCQLLTGSFFDSVPAGGDAYVMSHVIHDWDEEKCLTILRHCRQAMAQDSRLLIVECVLPPGDEPHMGKILDLVMLTVPGGQERSGEEYAGLLAKAGFRLTRIVPTASAVSVVEAQPV
ncbi:Dimerisation domain-containing protein [Polaromonas sp. OV174]|uniref:methyltransferase n=1 Tax=Polaromonas sp. OV174 TaxID=1855300 RepID=UPI0008E41B02|nr:methyltransferase [Polaromonas sp. OV174]SFC12957.1 Dimerisation domain-containing protein [Polaromonas sp. OV174]